MDMQSRLVHTLEEQAGLDEATAERVAHVAMDFTKEHGSELISESAPESMKSMVSGESAGGTAGEYGGATEAPVSGAAREVGAAAERVSTTPGEIGATQESGVGTPGETTATEEGSGEHPGGIGGVFSKLTGH